MSLFIYGTTENTGKGFITYEDSQNFHISGYPNNVWVISNTEKGALWMSSKNAVEKTKLEAQNLVDAEVTAEQTAWDALSDEEKNLTRRPLDIVLPQVFIMSSYNEIKGLKIKYLSGNPSNPEDGEVWYNSSTSKLVVAGVTGDGGWSSGGNLNTARRNMGASASTTQTAGLVFGGTPGAPIVGLTEEYNGSSWSESGDMATTRRDFGGAGTQTAALAFGGNTPATVNTETYDGSTWSEVNNLNTGRNSLAGAGLQSAALAIGGSVSPAAVESYNGSTWSEVGDLNTGRAGLGGLGTQTAALAVGGGSPGNAVEEWNGSSWTNANTTSTNRAEGTGEAGTQTAGLVYGGAPNTAATEAYDGTTWSNKSSMSTARSEIGFGGSQSAALAVGGNPVTAATEEFNIPILRNIT